MKEGVKEFFKDTTDSSNGFYIMQWLVRFRGSKTPVHKWTSKLPKTHAFIRIGAKYPALVHTTPKQIVVYHSPAVKKSIIDYVDSHMDEDEEREVIFISLKSPLTPFWWVLDAILHDLPFDDLERVVETDEFPKLVFLHAYYLRRQLNLNNKDPHIKKNKSEEFVDVRNGFGPDWKSLKGAHVSRLYGGTVINTSGDSYRLYDDYTKTMSCLLYTSPSPRDPE